MFDFSFAEMALAGVVALIVLGPERLPKVARFVGEWVGKIQRMAAGVKSELHAHAEYGELAKLKQDMAQTAQEIRQDLHDFEHKFQQETQAIPAWDRLPELKTPADFGVDELGQPLDVPPPVSGFYVKSLKKQAMSRRRDLRPRYRPKPKLRVRK